MPVLIFIAFLDLERKFSFLDRHYKVVPPGKKSCRLYEPVNFMINRLSKIR
jgi:hypothetical protein